MTISEYTTYDLLLISFLAKTFLVDFLIISWLHEEGKQFQFCDCKSKNVRFQRFRILFSLKREIKKFQICKSCFTPQKLIFLPGSDMAKTFDFQRRQKQGWFSITRCFTFKDFQCKKLRSSLDIVKQRSIDCYNNINLHFILTFNYKLSSKCARIKSTFC